jgi:hypothetical protein
MYQSLVVPVKMKTIISPEYFLVATVKSVRRVLASVLVVPLPLLVMAKVRVTLFLLGSFLILVV